jgi:large subunit ribosomal protein L24
MSLIKTNDTVKVIAGKEKGRKGKVLKIFSDTNRALVERVNFVKRHMRAGAQAGQQGGIIEKEAPIGLAKLMLVCPKCSQPARTGQRILDDGTKVRFCKRCDEQIDS